MLTPSVSVHDRINGAKNELRRGNFKNPERHLYVIPDRCGGEVHADIEENGDIDISVINSEYTLVGHGLLIYSAELGDFPGIMQTYTHGPNPLPLSDSQELGREIMRHHSKNRAFDIKQEKTDAEHPAKTDTTHKDL